MNEVKDTKVFISGQKRGVTRSIKKALKRRSAIEPEIDHMKNDGRLDRCYLKGAVGDAINVVMVAAGHNLRKILNKLRLLQGMDLQVPILSVAEDTFTTILQVEQVNAAIASGNPHKQALALGLFDRHVDGDVIFRQADITESSIMTPIMFEHRLLEQAKSQ